MAVYMPCLHVMCTMNAFSLTGLLMCGGEHRSIARACGWRAKNASADLWAISPVFIDSRTSKATRSDHHDRFWQFTRDEKYFGRSNETCFLPIGLEAFCQCKGAFYCQGIYELTISRLISDDHKPCAGSGWAELHISNEPPLHHSTLTQLAT